VRNTLLLGSLLLVVAAASCKKDKEEQEQQTCRITGADITSDTDSTHLDILYGADGRVTRVSAGELVTNFFYTGNTVRIERITLNLTYYDTVVLDDGGKILSSTYQVGQQSWRIENTYNGSELQRVITIKPGNPTVQDTTLYTWSGGNMVREDHRGQYGGPIEYYTDKPVVENSDVYRFSSLINSGGYTLLSRNLVKRMSRVGDTTNISYELDAAGRILLARYSGTGTVTRDYRFTYTCQ